VHAPTTAAPNFAAPAPPPAAASTFRLPELDRMMPVALLGVVAVLIVAPLLTIVFDTLTADGRRAWGDVVASDISHTVLWRPLSNTLIIGLGSAVGCVLVGGFLAWLVIMTDVPLRRTIGVLSTLPFMIPSFATALAWGALFRNERVGGDVGFLETIGLNIPDWLAWGLVPTQIVLIAHYYSLAFTVIAAALASVNGDLIEAAEMAGAKLGQIFLSIVLPVVTPALVAGGSLAFAGAVSNFAAPALLGLPVRMHTLSTRLFGMIETGQNTRGFVMAILLIAVSAVFLYVGERVVAGKKSFVTITGKGGRAKRFSLGRAKWPLFAIAALILVLTTIVPVVVLVASSLAPRSGELFANWTLHFWIGAGGGELAQGQAGIFRNPDLTRALGITLGLGLCVALTSTVIGLAIAHSIAKAKGTWLANALTQICFVPLLVPGIAFGAAYIALFGAPIGPFPALYGTFALLVLAATAYLLPFAVQSGRSVMGQVAGDLDESAKLTGAGFMRRLFAITLPLTIRGLIAGALLVFVKIVRDLSLVVLLFTTTTPVLSVLAFRYANEGFMQYAHAITVVIMAVSLVATILAQRLQNKAQPWRNA
jgi:iron(III) transport system permease protein